VRAVRHRRPAVVGVAVPMLAVLCGLLGAPAAQGAERLVRVALTDARADVAMLERLGLDVTHDVRRRSADVVVRGSADVARLRRSGLRSRVIVPDIAAAAASARRSEARAAATGRASALPSGRVSYRVYADHLAEMGELVARNPSLVRAVALPVASVEGRTIAGVEIAEQVARLDDGRPVSVVLGLHHAREWPSGEVALEFARDLVARHAGGDARVRALLARGRVIVVPVVNPDGFIVSREGAEPSRRKNCAAVGALEAAASCAGRSGVDLNRNYAAFWGGNGASPLPSDDTYRGPGPWSEPEARAVHELTRRLQVTNLISIHNIAGLVLRPPGFASQGLAPDEPRLKALGDAMAAAAGYASEYGYQLYEVTGATEDWNYAAQGAFGYTIELGGTGGFQGPYATNVVDQYQGRAGTRTEGRGVREALLLAAEQSVDPRDHSVLSGTAPAGRTLRLRKAFTTSTSPVCGLVGPPPDQLCLGARAPAMMLPDGLETTLVVGAGGTFTWHVNPSTRPFVAKAGGTEAWTLTCEGPDGSVIASRAVVVGRGAGVTGMAPCVDGPSGDGTPVPPRVGAAPATVRTLALRTAVDRQRVRTVAGARGLRVRARCTVRCTTTTTVTVSAATAQRLGLPRRTLGTATRRLRAARTTALHVRLTGPARRALAGRRGVAVVVRVVARDEGGTRARRAMRVTLS
jgi:hypothetical protein